MPNFRTRIPLLLILALLVACGAVATPIKDGGAVYAPEPKSPEAFIAVSTGLISHCALRVNGAASCGGSIIYDSRNFLPPHMWDEYERGSEPKNARFIDLSVGHFYICGLLTDGKPFCWGEDTYGEASPPAQETFTAISSSRNHTCALRSDGSPVCWGQQNPRIVPPADEKLIAIGSGYENTCGIRFDGSPACWHAAVGPSSSSPELPGTVIVGRTPSPWDIEWSPSPSCAPRPTVIVGDSSIMCGRWAGKGRNLRSS